MDRLTPRAALTPLHRLWRTLPMRARRAALANGAAALAPRPSRTPPAPDPAAGLIVAGELARASGLGEAARIVLRALAAAGVPAWPRDIGMLVAGETGGIALPPTFGEPGQGTPLLSFANPPMMPLALLRLGRRQVAGRRIIGYWFWELPVTPPAWRHGAKLVHEIWAPSRFTAAALEPLLPGRVRVVPLPIAACPPTPAPLDRAAFGLPDGVLVLVSFSLASSFARKNPLAAIAAFRAAFADRRDRTLLLKIGNPGHAPADMAAIAAAIDGAPNIRLMTATLGEAERHALTQAADIVLSLHRSEGFGLVPAEAMLLGVPVVATDWSGSTDFLDSDCGMPVPYRLVPARDPRGVYEAAGAVWAEADIAAAAACLTRLADDTTLRRRLGEAGRTAATARLTAGPLLAALAGAPPA